MVRRLTDRESGNYQFDYYKLGIKGREVAIRKEKIEILDRIYIKKSTNRVSRLW